MSGWFNGLRFRGQGPSLLGRKTFDFFDEPELQLTEQTTAEAAEAEQYAAAVAAEDAAAAAAQAATDAAAAAAERASVLDGMDGLFSSGSSTAADATAGAAADGATAEAAAVAGEEAVATGAAWAPVLHGGRTPPDPPYFHVRLYTLFHPFCT